MVCCGVLRCVAVCCGVLRCVVAFCGHVLSGTTPIGVPTLIRMLSTQVPPFPVLNTVI